MQNDDPLIRLLQTADSAAREPAPSADLADRALDTARRRDARSRLARRGTLGACAAAAMLLIVVAIRGGVSWRSDLPSPVEIAEHTPDAPDTPDPATIEDAAEIAQLRAEADAFRAEADALERELTLARKELARRELLEESERHSAVAVRDELMPTGSDRAAVIGLSEGDYYRDMPGKMEEAITAYRHVASSFPDSPFAAAARERLADFQMN